MLKNMLILFPVLYIIVLPILDKSFDSTGRSITELTLYCVLPSILLIKIFHTKVIHINTIDILSLFLFVWGCFKVIFSSIPTDFSSVSIFIIALYAYIYIRCGSVKSSLPYLLFCGGCIQGVTVMMQYFGLMPHYNLFYKTTGTFDTTALLGIYLSLSIISGFYLYVNKKKSVFIILPCITLLFYALYLSQSRTAWLALIIGFTYMFQLYKNKKFIYISIPILLLLSLYLYTLRPVSVIGRLYINLISLRIFCSSPISGHGVSSFKAMYMPAQSEWLSRHPESVFSVIADDNYFAFNEFIHIGCETGIIGLILFTSIIIKSLSTISTDSHNIFYYKSLLSGFCCFLLFSYPFNELFFVLLFTTIIACLSNYDYKSILSINIGKTAKIAITLLIIINIAIAFIHYKNCIASEKDIKNSYPILSSSALYMNRYGECLFNNNEYEKAIPILEQANRINPNSRMLDILGVCYLKQKRYDEALISFEQSKKMVPSRILPRFHLFQLHIETGDKNKAKETAIEILEFKVKIVNSTVIRIRNEMKIFLESLSQ